MAGPMHIILGALGLLLSLLIWLLPLGVLEQLSRSFIGEPPINGASWMEGVEALGGPFSMRLAATLGLVILLLGVRRFLAGPNTDIPSRRVGLGEMLGFFGVAVLFGLGNFHIGYAWWDPGAVLGMGPRFVPSMSLLLGIGFAPRVAGRVFGHRQVQTGNLGGMLKVLPSVLLIAFGYGLVSCLWHCCCFFAWKMVFFFVVIKGVQLWAMCSFFYGWGLKMLVQAWGSRWRAGMVISVLFGFCYPWHTLGFAAIFTFFGFLLCVMMRKTDSYWAGWWLLYLAYLFHAGLPWHGGVVTHYLILPLAVLVLALEIKRTLHHGRSC